VARYAQGGLIQQLALHARRAAGVNLPFSATTPLSKHNSSPQQAPFPGSQEMERRIKSLVRWNALAMVVRANKFRKALAGTFPRLLRPPLCTRLLSIISFKLAPKAATAISFYFQGHARARHLRSRLSRRPHP